MEYGRGSSYKSRSSSAPFEMLFLFLFGKFYVNHDLEGGRRRGGREMKQIQQLIAITPICFKSWDCRDHPPPPLPPPPPPLLSNKLLHESGRNFPEIPSKLSPLGSTGWLDRWVDESPKKNLWLIFNFFLSLKKNGNFTSVGGQEIATFSLPAVTT